MAKRQTRRSISVRGITYQRLKNYCDARGLSISGFLEQLIAERMDAEGEPVPDKLEHVPRPRQPVREEIISQHFTF